MRTINSRNIARLQNAFIDYLIENEIPFLGVKFLESDESLVFILEKSIGGRIFKFKKEAIIGYEPAEFIESIIKPVLNRIKPVQ